MGCQVAGARVPRRMGVQSRAAAERVPTWVSTAGIRGSTWEEKVDEDNFIGNM